MNLGPGIIDTSSLGLDSPGTREAAPGRSIDRWDPRYRIAAAGDGSVARTIARMPAGLRVQGALGTKKRPVVPPSAPQTRRDDWTSDPIGSLSYGPCLAPWALARAVSGAGLPISGSRARGSMASASGFGWPVIGVHLPAHNGGDRPGFRVKVSRTRGLQPGPAGSAGTGRARDTLAGCAASRCRPCRCTAGRSAAVPWSTRSGC